MTPNEDVVASNGLRIVSMSPSSGKSSSAPRTHRARARSSLCVRSPAGSQGSSSGAPTRASQRATAAARAARASPADRALGPDERAVHVAPCAVGEPRAQEKRRRRDDEDGRRGAREKVVVLRRDRAVRERRGGKDRGQKAEGRRRRPACRPERGGAGARRERGDHAVAAGARGARTGGRRRARSPAAASARRPVCSANTAAEDGTTLIPSKSPGRVAPAQRPRSQGAHASGTARRALRTGAPGHGGPARERARRRGGEDAREKDVRGRREEPEKRRPAREWAQRGPTRRAACRGGARSGPRQGPPRDGARRRRAVAAQAASARAAGRARRRATSSSAAPGGGGLDEEREDAVPALGGAQPQAQRGGPARKAQVLDEVGPDDPRRVAPRHDERAARAALAAVRHPADEDARHVVGNDEPRRRGAALGLEARGLARPRGRTAGRVEEDGAPPAFARQRVAEEREEARGPHEAPPPSTMDENSGDAWTRSAVRRRSAASRSNWRPASARNASARARDRGARPRARDAAASVAARARPAAAPAPSARRRPRPVAQRRIGTGMPFASAHATASG